MAINISNLNPLSNVSFNSGTSQNSDNLATEANSPLSSSLLGSSNQNNNDNSLAFTPILNISNTAQVLSKRQNTLSKTLIKLSDDANRLHSAQLGLNQVKTLMNTFRKLLSEAENASLSSEERSVLNQKIKANLKEYNQLIDGTLYSGTKVLGEEKTVVVHYSESKSEEKTQIHFPDFSSETLELDQLDVSSFQNTVQSLNILNTASFGLSNTLDQFENARAELDAHSENLHKMLEGILKMQNITTDTIQNLVQNLQKSDLNKTQNTKLLANITSSLLV